MPSVREGYSLILGVNSSDYYISYNGMNIPVSEDDIPKENEDIQIYPKSDILVTFKCEITGRES